MGRLSWFSRPRPQARAAQALYAGLVVQARTPALYARMGAADTLEGRFEVYALHLALLVLRLNREGEPGEAVAQSLFDRFIRGLEDGLREAGVGDTTVPKRMKTLGQAVYGRFQGYGEALGALPDRTALEALVARTVLAEADGDPAPLADYVARANASLDGQAADALRSGTVQWPEVP